MASPNPVCGFFQLGLDRSWAQTADHDLYLFRAYRQSVFSFQVPK